MSRKKKKTTGPQPGENPGRLQQGQKSRRMEPLARNLLFCDLIFMALCEMLSRQQLLPEPWQTLSALLGGGLLLAALYLQFR